MILFSAFIFFNTLNPELLKVRFKPISVSLKTKQLEMDNENARRKSSSIYENFKKKRLEYSKQNPPLRKAYLGFDLTSLEQCQSKATELGGEPSTCTKFATINDTYTPVYTFFKKDKKNG